MANAESKESIQITEKLKQAGLEPIHPGDARTEQESRGAVRVELEGGGEDLDLAALLEDTAKFIRAMEKGAVSAGPFEHREFMFQRLGLSDYVIMAHRS